MRRLPRPRAARSAPAVLAVLAAAVALAACSGSDGGDEGSSAAAPTGGAATTVAGATAGEGAVESGSPAGGGSEAGGDVAPVLVAASQAGRMVVYTATVALRADDPQGAARAAVALAERAGGSLHGQETLGGQDGPRVTLVLKVPPDAVRTTLDGLAALGEVVHSNLDGQDVTERYVDLEARVATLRASVARLRELFAGAGTVGELAALEGELTRREADLESLEGQRRALEQQAAMATITLTVEPTAAAAAEEEDDDRSLLERVPGFGDALRGGATALAVTGKVALTVAGAALPFAVLAVVVGGPVWLLRRRGGRGAIDEPASATMGR